MATNTTTSSSSAPIISSSTTSLPSLAPSPATPLAPAPQDENIDSILARVNFFESSLEQVKRDFPRYLQQLAEETEKVHQVMSKLLKSVASAEPNQVLQYILFLYAQKEELLGKEQIAYKDRIQEVKDMMESWSNLLILPMRDIIADYHLQIKKSGQQVIAAVDNNNTTSSSPNPPSQAPTTPSLPIQPTTMASARTLLPIHVRLFEKHRLAEMKRLLRTVLVQEVQYHSKALEAYAQVLECLQDANERDNLLPA
eukprot:gene3273-3587_t